MQGTRAIFIAYLVVIATGLVLYSVVGIVRSADPDAPLGVVSAFNAALDDEDGRRACALLDERARSAVERERRKPCEQGIVEIRGDIALDGGAERVDAAESSSVVTGAGGAGAVFLGRHDGRWLIGAAGCERQAGDAPYECELEG